MLTADEVLTARFATGGMFRSGYDANQVDDWLDTVVSTLHAYQGDAEGTVQLLAEDAREARFKVARGAGAYDLDQVDAMIDRIVEALGAHERSV